MPRGSPICRPVLETRRRKSLLLHLFNNKRDRSVILEGWLALRGAVCVLIRVGSNSRSHPRPLSVLLHKLFSFHNAPKSLICRHTRRRSFMFSTLMYHCSPVPRTGVSGRTPGACVSYELIDKPHAPFRKHSRDGSRRACAPWVRCK